MGEITELLARARAGNATARDAFFARVYDELNRLARQKLSRSSTLTHLDAPSLVHEAYLRLNGRSELPGNDRRAFFAYAASVMRGMIVDYVRARNARKRGGGQVQVTLTSAAAELPGVAPDIEALDSALRALATVDERAARVVEMRYFGGLSIEDTAAALGMAPATVKRDWQKARAFLFQALRP